MSLFLRLARRACWALALVVPAAYAVQDCDINGVSVNPANGYTTAGKTGMMRCRDRDTGQLVREQELSAGKFTGLVRNYKNGKPVLEYQVNEKGNRQGRLREFSESGQVLRDESYTNGENAGVGRAFYPNGKLKRATSYDDDGREQAYAQYNERGQLSDLRCATTVVFGDLVNDAALCGHSGKPSKVDLFQANGTLHAQATFLAGKRVHFTTFWDNGKPATDIAVSDSARSERAYSRDGIMLRDERWVYVDHGFVKESEQIFQEGGALTSERRWAKGELVSERAFYLNGQPRRTMTHKVEGGVPSMTVEEFFDDGKLSTQGTYIDGSSGSSIPVGSHKQYDAQGHLRAEAIYDPQGRLQRVREWADNGTQTRDDDVYPDGSRKLSHLSGAR